MWHTTSFLLLLLFFSLTTTSTPFIEKTDQMPLPKAFFSGAVVRDLAIFAGGNNTTKTLTDDVEIYNATNMQWRFAKLSSPKDYLVAGVARDIAMFGGGGFPPSAIVDIYNASVDEWSSTSLSIDSWMLAGASLQTKIFFGGGFSSSLGRKTDLVNIYDVNTNSWSTEHLSVPRYALVGTSLGQFVFFAGGNDTTNNVSSVIDIYDSINDAWTSTQLSQPRAFMCATSTPEKSFFVGGLQPDKDPSFRIDTYDVTSGVLSTLSLPPGVIIGEGGCMATSLQETIILAGGGYNGTVTFDDIAMYDTWSDQWSNTTLSKGRSNGVVVTLSQQNSILIAGGEDNKKVRLSNLDHLIFNNTLVNSVQTIYQPVYITGNLTIDKNATIILSSESLNVTSIYISTSGCVIIKGGTLEIVLDHYLKNDTIIIVVESQSGCLLGQFDEVNITKDDPQTNCPKQNLNAMQNNDGQKLSLMFSSSGSCSSSSENSKKTKAIIACVIALVILLVLIVMILSWIYQRQITQCVRSKRKREDFFMDFATPRSRFEK